MSASEDLVEMLTDIDEGYVQTSPDDNQVYLDRPGRRPRQVTEWATALELIGLAHEPADSLRWLLTDAGKTIKGMRPVEGRS